MSRVLDAKMHVSLHFSSKISFLGKKFDFEDVRIKASCTIDTIFG